MAKVALFMPYPDSCSLAESMLVRYPHVTPLCMECIPNDMVVIRAREMRDRGCDLIMARGLQASMIKASLPLPMVEIRATVQEVARAACELKQKLDNAYPVLALVGFSNMFPDLTHFDELFGVQLMPYPVQDEAALTKAAARAVEDGADALIGGHTVCEQARRMGVPCCFLTVGQDSLRAALELADLSSQAIDQEKRNIAEITVMLDNTRSGMLQADRTGLIRRANSAAYQLLRKEPGQLINYSVSELLPALDSGMIQAALQEGQETDTVVPEGQDRALIVSINPIMIEGRPDGMLITLQEGDRIIRMDSELRRELYQQGYIAKYSFSNLVCCSDCMQQTVKLGKRIARYAEPVLLQGEAGSGKSIVAQCLHNESLLRRNAFVSLDCGAWLPDTVDTMLFGTYNSRRDGSPCMVELAENGTLYLAHVEALPRETQYKLFCLIHGHFWHNGCNRPSKACVRVIASTDANLMALVAEGKFRSDLYYTLQVLSLSLPPLRHRREDIRGWVEHYLEEWQRRSKRQVHLTQGAWRFLQQYDWPGNLEQISSLCQRIVLLAEKRNVDEVFLRRQIETISPSLDLQTGEIVRYRDRRADHITELLHRYQGNRSRVAQELGVSKTTLWRYMKKYGLGQEDKVDFTEP